MNKFIPRLLLAKTVACEILSKIALIAGLWQVPILVSASGFSGRYELCIFATAIFFFAIFHFLSQRFSLSLGGSAKNSLRVYFQEKFLNLSPIQDRAQKGMPLQELSLHYMKVADQMEAWYSRFLPSAFLAVFVPLIIFFVMLFVDKITAAILFFTGLLLPLFLFLIGKIAGEKSKKQWQSFAKTRAFFLESLQGYKTTKIFRKVAERTRDLEIAETEFGERTLGVLKTAFLSSLVQEWAGSLSIALVAVSLALRLLNGTMEFGTAFLSLLLTPEFYRPIRQFGSAFHTAINAKTGWDGLTFPQSSPFPPPTLRTDAPALTLHTPSSDYAIAPGNPLYIAGESGVGKTRLVLEFFGFIENESPVRLYGGDPKNIAYLPQNPTWFKGTLLENLCPAGECELCEVQAVLSAVNLGHFAKRLQEQVLEYAANFSGGEKRRLAIARIILLNRPTWILDEPFAGLNEEIVAVLEKLIEKESQSRAILCISHNKGTIERASRVWRMEGGL
ncbi:thiol reductant ABC exporter subunit CydD [Fibrobacterales bacterium]|nr:thiol reductant ABC exporter subunit CydD [Fibrobacterales bacterium]